MLDEIISIYNHTDYDFRNYAFPGDDLSYLFDEWVDYYRMKYAIAKVIRPKSILEIGVRYGYSAITFLEASECAKYLGIDTDSDTFGGEKGAVNWAKKITTKYNADFLLADSQSITSLPGDFYDFIHIDGQQDGDGTFHDLELALEKGRWILVDGYFWSNENLLSATYFLNKYKDFVEFVLTIPSYAGELLIKTKESARHIFTKYSNKNYLNLKDSYDFHYFLKDCGGYDSFKKYKGKKLEDPRLIAMCCLVDPRKEMDILDVGCGRGELSYALSRSGAKVTGIDYSSSAIKIANATYIKHSSVSKLKFIQDDFLSHQFNKKFDRIIATDFIEHIEEDKLELMIKKIKDLLKEDGLFIVHTYPNKLYYQYAYDENRKRAKSIGVYLPLNPRTFYEDLMHINEQTPQSLALLLRKYFPSQLTWVNNYPDFLGSLVSHFSLEECSNGRTIFALGSLKNIDKNVTIQLLKPKKLDRDGINIDISSIKNSLQVFSNEKFELDVTIKNNGRERLVSLPTYPVHISYHWLKEDGNYEIFDGIRTQIIPALNPQEQRDIQVDIVSPEEGKYQLQIDLVQEGCFWFEEIIGNIPLSINTEVEKKPDECRLGESKVDTFEIKDEEINVEKIMEIIRENIKKRKEAGIYIDGNPKVMEEAFSEISCLEENTSKELEIISSYIICNDSYSISSHRPVSGKFLIKGRKLVHGEVRRYVDPMFQEQNNFNSNVTRLLKATNASINSYNDEIVQLKYENEQLKNETTNLISEVNHLKAGTKQLKNEINILNSVTEQLKGEICQLNNVNEQLKYSTEKLANEIIINVKKEVSSVISSIDLDLDNKAWLNRILEVGIRNRSENQMINFSEDLDSEMNYYIFEERFRGSRDSIRQHQNNFMHYFENCTNVLDIGCGRGEFLELSKEKGINAWGVDVDEDMVNFCKSKGLSVELKDAIEALGELEDKSLDGIFISQVVEHLSPGYIIKMLNLCNRKLKYGFYVVIETVNPLSLFSLANFYIDLSHLRPVHPETMRFLLNVAGFRDIDTKFLSPVPDEMKLRKISFVDDLTEKDRLMAGIYNQNIDLLNNALYGAQDYTVIGKK